MSIPPVTIQPRAGQVPPAQHVRFNGISDAMASSVGFLENSRIWELLSTDLLGMCAPRTGIEWAQRGPDAARETAIREIAGLVGNLFVVGWISKMLLGRLGNSVNAYNPQGIPGKAWVNVRMMQTLGEFYEKALQANTANPAKARDEFIQAVFKDITSADDKLGRATFSQVNAEVLEKSGKTIAPSFLDGTLTQDARTFLQTHYQRQDVGPFGTRNLDKQAQALVDELSKGKNYTDEQLGKLFTQKRLDLSQQQLGGALKDFLDEADTKAKLGGLSDEVKLGGQVFKRRDVLEQLKHFLEQGVDRATNEPLTGKTRSAEQILTRLFGESAAPDKGLQKWLHRLRPSAEDGIMTAMRKSKFLYTTVPVVLGSALSIAVAFYNNYLTRKKHGGVNFFPGEGGPPQAKGQAPAATPTPPAPAVPQLQAPTPVATANAPVTRPAAPTMAAGQPTAPAPLPATYTSAPLNRHFQQQFMPATSAAQPGGTPQ